MINAIAMTSWQQHAPYKYKVYKYNSKCNAYLLERMLENVNVMLHNININVMFAGKNKTNRM